MMPENLTGKDSTMPDIQVQLKMDERHHRTLKYRAAQTSQPMGRLVEAMLASLKQRALRIHKRLGAGTYVDDAIIIRCLLDGDRRGFSEDEIMDWVSVDMIEAEADGIEVTFEGADA